MHEKLKIAKEFLKTGKGKAALGGGTAVTAAAVATGVLLSGQAYRTIAVEEVNGTSIIQNEEQESSTAYAGMHLNSGDDVTVQAVSDMTMLLDMDKYVYAEENTHFWLEAEGDPETSRTRIHLDRGAELNRLNTELAEGETYEVDTPNSVMAVRGTVFRVCVYYDDAGLAWTSFEVYDGEVEVTLKTLEGEFNGVAEVFGPGEAALIRASDDFSEFVVGEDGKVKRPIMYKEIPQSTAKKLVEFMDDGDVLCIAKELLMDYTKLEEHKMEEVVTEEATCSKEGKKVIRCTVCNEEEETVTIPRLSHTVSEEWEIIEEPDCENTGLEQKVCTACGEVMETWEIDALGHTPGEFVVTTEATCEQEGERVQRCSVCDAVLQRETIAALGHITGNWQTTVNATCTLDGQLSDTCSRCGVITAVNSIPALGHSYGGWTVTSHASCTSSGSESRTCSRCGHSETTRISSSGHSYGDWTVTSEATCTSDGSQSRTCRRCGSTETSTIAASGHSYGEWTEVELATCEAPGSQNRTCSLCGNVETSEIAMLEHTRPAEPTLRGHDFVNDSFDWDSFNTDLLDDGQATMSYSYECSVCGTLVTENHTITADITEVDGEVVMEGPQHCVDCDMDLEW